MVQDLFISGDLLPLHLLDIACMATEQSKRRVSINTLSKRGCCAHFVDFAVLLLVFVFTPILPENTQPDFSICLDLLKRLQFQV